jgi:hypothetical protein
VISPLFLFFLLPFKLKTKKSIRRQVQA